MAIQLYEVIQGHRFWYQWKTHAQFPVSEYIILIYILSCTISKISCSSSQIFTFDAGATL